MKKITFLFFLSTFYFVLTLSAQSWTAGNSNLYANPTTTRVGIGTMSPAYPLHVNGKIFLESVDVLNNWGSSYLHWNSHSLVMGTPAGHYAHNSVDLKPGGVTQEPLISQFRMFTATGLNQHELKIYFNTGGNCIFNNPGNVGIGTSTPAYKLDVDGTVRAREVRINLNSGADFVFENGYNLMNLNDLSRFIEENKHLPDIPSAEE